MNQRGVADRWPVLLGGAALTRAYVEQDLAEIYDGEVRYARDAFEGLRLMDAVDGASSAACTGRRPALAARCAERRAQRPAGTVGAADADRAARTMPAPLRRRGRQPGADAAVLGRPRRQGHPARRLRRLPRRAGARSSGQWGLKPAPRRGGPSYEELVETEGRPRLRMWLDRLQTEGLLEAGVVYGYFPCVSEGDDLIVLRPDDATARSGPASPSRASAATGTCAWRTSSGRGKSGRDRRGRVPAS